jgi:hypothetical protein
MQDGEESMGKEGHYLLRLRRKFKGFFNIMAAFRVGLGEVHRGGGVGEG